MMKQQFRIVFSALVVAALTMCPTRLFSQNQNVLIPSLYRLDLANRADLYQRLAERWAPVIFANSDITNGNMDPADAIISPDFDGDGDYRNNPQNVEALVDITEKGKKKKRPKFTFKAQMLYSIAETESHYYVTYTKYNAIDRGYLPFWGAHGQDSEAIWTVIKKDSSPMGSLEFVATNAHGIPMFYSPNSDLQKEIERVREQTMSEEHRKRLSGMKVAERNFFKHHNEIAPPVFHKPESKDSGGLYIYMHCGKHSLGKCSPGKWYGRDAGQGYVYRIKPLGQESIIEWHPVKPLAEREIFYSVRSIDKELMELYPWDKNSVTPELQVLQNMRFEGNQSNRICTEAEKTVYCLREDLPTYFVKGNNDEKAEANLSHDWGVGTPYKLALPHLVHRYYVKDEVVSDFYVFNPYVKFTD